MISFSSCLFFKIHLVPILFLSLGLRTKYNTSFLINWFNYSYSAVVQYSSPPVSSTFFGSNWEVYQNKPILLCLDCLIITMESFIFLVIFEIGMIFGYSRFIPNTHFTWLSNFKWLFILVGVNHLFRDAYRVSIVRI